MRARCPYGVELARGALRAAQDGNDFYDGLE